MKLFSENIIEFYKTLKTPRIPLKQVDVLEPHKNKDTWQCMNMFFEKFFADTQSRVFVLGINPGRLGAGITGIPFTDPVALENKCHITNAFEKREEMSSKFIYRFIEDFGGVDTFYKNFFLTSVSPLGFMCNGKNYNYYDDAALHTALTPYIIKTLTSQCACGARKDTAIILGTGKNHKAFTTLNEKYKWFQTVHTLEHPRYIMQYRSRNISNYLDKYQKTFSKALLNA